MRGDRTSVEMDIRIGVDAHGGGECEVRKRLGWLHGKMPHAEEV